MSSSDIQHFRKILPAEADLESAGTTATTSSSASAHAEALPTSLPYPSDTLEESERSKRKRSRTQVSCNDCRRKKIRACRKKLTPCVYPEPPDEITVESSEILQVLLSSSDIEALDILRMLRANHEPAAVLSVLKATSDCRAKSSAPTIDCTCQGPSHSSLEFELMRKNPIAYPALLPLPIAAQKEPSLVRPFNTPQTNLMGPRAFLGSPEDSNRTPALAYCDERLRDLDVTFLTDIIISNELAARIISQYLATDHPLLGIFDPDLFVSDLQMYSAIDESVYHFIQPFGDEAKSLWTQVKSSDTLSNLAGAQLLSLAFLGHGKDHFVLIYLAEASRMATRMCLFGVEPAVALSKTNEIPQDMRSASCYAAWGIFNWTILTSLFYQQPGLEYPEYPPVLPIPVRSNQTSPLRNFSEVSTTQDHETHTLWYMGETFAYLCKFWQILHGVTIVYHKRNQEPFRPVNEHVSVEFAERKYRELLALADTLPSSLIHSGDSPHHVLIFHLWFHAAILDIFRPFIEHPVARQSRLTTFSSSESSPEAAFRASLTQLKRLVVVYRSKYQSSEHTILWHTALIYVANAVLQDTRDPEWHFYFLQCVSGYESLRKSYRLAEVVGRALLSMTLRNGDISGTEARELLQRLKQKGLDNDTSDRIRATFMGDLELAMTNPRQASVENLAEQFEDMALWQEFTNTEGV